MQWFFDIVEDMMLNAGFINDWARANMWQNVPQVLFKDVFTRIHYHVISFSNRVTVNTGLGKLTIQDDGFYMVASSVGIDAIGAGTRIHASIHIDGDFGSYVVFYNGAAGEDPRIFTLAFRELHAGDALTLWAYHNDIVNRNSLAQEFSTWLGVHLLSK